MLHRDTLDHRVGRFPHSPRGEVDRAGRLLAENGVADPLAIGHALDVINNWRSSHSFPLNTFQMTLRNRAASVCGDPIVARRAEARSFHLRETAAGSLR